MSKDYVALLKAGKANFSPLDRTDKTDKTLLAVLSVPHAEEKNTFVSFVSSLPTEKKPLFQQEEEREVFEERAAICEFDGGMSREDAEALARQEAQFRAEHHAGVSRHNLKE
jgi:hypothetical protein